MSTNKHKKFHEYTLTYNHCGICGYVPKTQLDEPNRTPILFWEPDDGWVIRTLCRYCFEECADREPHPDDYAYDNQETVHIDESSVDEDPSLALDW